MPTFKSGRNIELYWDPECGTPRRPTITTENYCKWYSLFVVSPDGKVGALHFEDLEEYCDPCQSAFSDHIPNPEVVRRCAEAEGKAIDGAAWCAMLERWHRQYFDAETLVLHGVMVAVREVRRDFWICAENLATGDGYITNGETRDEAVAAMSDLTRRVDVPRPDVARFVAAAR